MKDLHSHYEGPTGAHGPQGNYGPRGTSGPTVTPEQRRGIFDELETYRREPVKRLRPWAIYTLLALILLVLCVWARDYHNAQAWKDYKECQERSYALGGHSPETCDYNPW